MAKINLLLAGLYATSAFASPWFRNKKRGDGWGTETPAGQPYGYGSTKSPAPTSPWGYGTTSTCEATTVTEVETRPGEYVSCSTFNVATC